jgi:hypothetical protein
MSKTTTKRNTGIESNNLLIPKLMMEMATAIEPTAVLRNGKVRFHKTTTDRVIAAFVRAGAIVNEGVENYINVINTGVWGDWKNKNTKTIVAKRTMITKYCRDLRSEVKNKIW